MTWNLNGKEFESVVQLPPQKRYEYFIKKVADWRGMWSLWNEGVLMGDKNGDEMVPVWPHPLFAEALAVGDWLGYTSKRITLDDWLTRWTAGIEQDHWAVAVFPVPKAKPQRLLHSD